MTREPVKGDKVIYYGRKAIVDSYRWNRNGDRLCEITYVDQSFPVSEQVYSEHLIIIDETPPPFKPNMRKSWINSEIYCPICETKWTVTKFQRQVWYDCCICKKTKEQIMKD